MLTFNPFDRPKVVRTGRDGTWAVGDLLVTPQEIDNGVADSKQAV